ncbi:MAG: DUF1512 domain-containing protein [Desulfurococcaceae archaeon]
MDTGLLVQVFWIVFFLLIITGLYQRIQLRLWILELKTKLSVMRAILEEDKQRVKNLLRNLGLSTPEVLLSRTLDTFIIEPVEIEPVDIIRRLDHLLRTSENHTKRMIEDALPKLGKHERSLVESSIAIVVALNQIYKVVRHYVLIGEKENNYILIMQLQYILPQIMKIVETYHEALTSFMNGLPIGDGVGPLLAYMITERGEVRSRTVVDDTSIIEVMYKNRRLFVVKAEGPGSNVGHPGAIISKLVDDLKGAVDLVITVDAALKLEGEETGSIAEGYGAAIGDLGPEKIAIERATAKYNIPLRALVIKMDLKDAITTMKKELYDAIEEAISYVDRIIEEHTKPNSTLILAGIGNTMGIPG